MNIPALAADIAARVPAMARDNPQNNATLIEGLIRNELEPPKCPRCDGLGYLISGHHLIKACPHPSHL